MLPESLTKGFSRRLQVLRDGFVPVCGRTFPLSNTESQKSISIDIIDQGLFRIALHHRAEGCVCPGEAFSCAHRGFGTFRGTITADQERIGGNKGHVRWMIEQH